MTAFMEFSPQGKMLRHDFFETVINSDARLTYSQVAAALGEPSEEEPGEISALLPDLELMKELALRIRRLPVEDQLVVEREQLAVRGGVCAHRLDYAGSRGKRVSRATCR